MNGNQRSQGSNYWISLLLILLGVLFLLQNFGVFYLGDLWDFWPLVLIAIGMAKLFGSGFKDLYSSGVLVGFGLLALLANMHFIYWSDIWSLWPLVLILIGGRIILNHRKGDDDRSERADSFAEIRIDAVAIFGGKEMRLQTERFEGGSITAAFGGAEIYLDDARMATGKNVIDVFVMFGGVEIYVPRDWKVVVKGIPIFGGFSDNRKNVETGLPEAADRTLVINGFVMFGGVDIKTS